MEKFLVIGYGIAGLCVTRQLEKRGLDFHVIDNHFKHSSSKVAAGMWNPIGFKRVTKSWKADELLPYAQKFYAEFDEQFMQKFTYSHDLIRFFSSIEEENSWFEKVDDPRFSAYLSVAESPMVKNLQEKLVPPYKHGNVRDAGRVDISRLLSVSKENLVSQNSLQETELKYEELSYSKGSWNYQGNQYSHLIFCEGHQISHNPYFNYLPIIPNKGEVFILRIPNLNLEGVINRGFFVLPLGDDLYKVGATFNSRDQSYEPSEDAETWLSEKIKSLIAVPYEVVEHHCGIRPTVPDRKPIVGAHPEQENMFVFNGLGAKGIYLAPKLSDKLMDHILMGEPLPKEISISRYKK